MRISRGLLVSEIKSMNAGMSSLCARMETLSRNGERQPVPHLLSRLYVEYDHVRHILEAVLADAMVTDV